VDVVTIILSAGAGACLLAGLLSLLPVAHGIARIWDFPRLQILAVCVALLVLTPLAIETPGWRMGIAVVLAAGALIQIVRILPYTPLWPVQSKKDGSVPDNASLMILTSNVKMSNRGYHRLLGLIAEQGPDIVLLMETDQRWIEALGELKERYPHHVLQPHENTYGMALFSCLELSDPIVRDLCLTGVPSIAVTVHLPGRERFRLYAVHPEPPVPHADTVPRDAEIIMVARMAKKEELPVIVAGDLNDVAWSRTTLRFQKLSGLLDPRMGRGFYNSFHADYWFARWPLDHLFHSHHFRLVDLRRLPSIGSDHFPMRFCLALKPAPDTQPRPAGASRAEEAEAAAILTEAEAIDRDPLGADWEKG
jgi:endonuclease/exonuclease/phosphatase (EEP) superfamily protein YafD